MVLADTMAAPCFRLSGFRVLGYMIKGIGYMVWGIEYEIYGTGLRV